MHALIFRGGGAVIVYFYLYVFILQLSQCTIDTDTESETETTFSPVTDSDVTIWPSDSDATLSPATDSNATMSSVPQFKLTNVVHLFNYCENNNYSHKNFIAVLDHNQDSSLCEIKGSL